MAGQGIVEFVRDVRREASRVTWPTRRETLITTGMVFLMVILASIFILAVDQVFALAVRALQGIGG
ncbi:MAG: preprotein translocase subunit SecE [Pseudomonadota bacterium]|nr:preprotein translocase subunit SecE [Pseudomonadota bacterium]